jgi:hypothetical protein
VVLEYLICILFCAKRHDAHQDRDGVSSFFRQNPLDDPWLVFYDDRLDEPKLFQLMQSHDENPGRQAGERTPDLVKPIDL